MCLTATPNDPSQQGYGGRVPTGAAGKDINIIARAADNGAYTLASYRRILVRVH